MDRVARSALSSFQRVQEFVAQLPTSSDAPTLGPQAKELAEVIARLSSSSVEQEAGGRFARVHTEAQRRLRQTLYTEHIQPIARVAREVFGVSGMDRAFRMPRHTTVNQKVLAAAGAMAVAAQKEREVFVRHGLPQDFVEQLEKCASALEGARNARVESGRRRVTATADVVEQVKRGKKAVRLLDAILQPRLAKDPELLAAWRSAKRMPPAATAVGASAEPAPAPGSEKAA